MKSQTEREKAYRKIREAIMIGTLKPGEKLAERHLCEMLELGRTPIREAIRQLESEGFLRVVPNRGAYVINMSIHDIEEVAEVVGVLEGYGAAKAAKIITPKQLNELKKIGAKFHAIAKDWNYEAYAELDFKFHDFFPRIIGNTFLIAEIRKMRNKSFRLRSPRTFLFVHVNEFIRDHEKIIEAMSERDPKKACDAMQLHVKRAKDHFIQFLKENSWIL
ncbi:GntR family transcriptional regulator [Desulfosarcina ovata subsp. sediminis]|uniref:GntR family transcriptional regulator n=1 Tax=Desulfosarcina ovata subsp. sediminis TaxID=885957 RepID=A0A5K7ZNU7_9BACT|nr:GntR family transcriptional regulator [Desulfosarcina ovata]BBO82047.1 GntR family transcriptional regulator [Desulfosarcina ovata subsp. sediminis]